MDQQVFTDKPVEEAENPIGPQRHPITLENSPEETIRRMRSLPERADKLRESLRVLRETNAR